MTIIRLYTQVSDNQPSRKTQLLPRTEHVHVVLEPAQKCRTIKQYTWNKATELHISCYLNTGHLKNEQKAYQLYGLKSPLLTRTMYTYIIFPYFFKRRLHVYPWVLTYLIGIFPVSMHVRVYFLYLKTISLWQQGFNSPWYGLVCNFNFPLFLL